MSKVNKLSQKDFEDFFIRTYFGAYEDYIDACIQRAYLDFNRTLHGMAKLDLKGELFEKSKINLRFKIDKLKDQKLDQNLFNSWHYETCCELKKIYANYSYPFYIGQAQKWVNMTLKYMFALREERVTGFMETYQYCHIHIDNIMLDKFKAYKIPTFFNCKWSRIDDYFNEYLPFQEWIRSTFDNYNPLELEFLLWLNKSIYSDN